MNYFCIRMYCLLRPCLHVSYRLATKIRLKYICFCIGILMLLDFFGAFTHIFEVTYDSNFEYPYEGRVHEFVHALRHNGKPAVDPINVYNYTFILDNKQKCVEVGYSTFRVVYIVKSAIENIDRRTAIRNSWGFEKRFFDVPSRTVFLLGVHPNDDELQAKIKVEAAKYKDIIQIDFIDSYYNNTIKTMMGFKWMVKYCSNAKFYMFVDDDMYVSVKNVLRFIRNPVNYPDYMKEPKKFEAHKREIKRSDMEEVLFTQSTVTKIHNNTENNESFLKESSDGSRDKSNHSSTQDPDNPAVTIVSANVNSFQPNNEQLSKSTDSTLNSYFNYTACNESSVILNRRKRQIFDFQLPEDVRLFAGYVFVSSPHRHKSSKWYVPLNEYPYHLWPPYVTAGAFVLSKEALLEMYYTSLYTKHFRFDDIFLGLVAKKADIEPFHCEEFHFYKKDYTKFNYKYVITSHGYGDPNELLYVWNEQKALGNA